MRINHAVTAAACVLLAAPPVARAQASPPAAPTGTGAAQVPSRPFRGLFGGEQDAEGRGRHVLDLALSLYGSYDDNVLGQGGQSSAGIDPRMQRSGAYSGADASLRFIRRWRHGSLDFTGGSQLRYYPEMTEFTSVSHSGSLALRTRPGRRTDLAITAAGSYSPYYSFSYFPGLDVVTPGDPVSPQSDFSIYRQPTVSWNAAADLTHRLGRRATSGLAYTATRRDFRPGPWTRAERQSSFSDQAAGGRLEWTTGRYSSIRLGYTFRESDYGTLFAGGLPLKQHNLDVGLNYNRPLTRSRRTTLSIRTGSSLIQIPQQPAQGEGRPLNPNYRNHARAFVDASLLQLLGRTWSTRLDYRRGLFLVEGVGTPFFSDSVGWTMDGFLGARVRLKANGGYSSAAAETQLSGLGFDTWTAGAEAQVAITRHTAAFASYLFYRYRFASGMILPPGFGTAFDRNGVRIGINVWAPLLK